MSASPPSPTSPTSPTSPPPPTSPTSRRESPRAAVAHRWRVATERLVAARYRFQLLHEAEVPDIRELRRAARMIHDLELERGALGRELESALRS